MSFFCQAIESVRTPPHGRSGCPYGTRDITIPDGGHVTFFQDKKGGWWSTFFGADKTAPIVQKHAIVPMIFEKDGMLKVDSGRFVR